MKRLVFTLVAAAAAVIVGISMVQPPSDNTASSTSGALKTAIADGVVESVEVVDRIPSIKRSVLVRLLKKPSVQELEEIANDIKADDPSYERTFIAYLMPGMVDGAGAWAITHFDPDLKVQILGTPADKERELSVLPAVSGREVLGA